MIYLIISIFKRSIKVPLTPKFFIFLKKSLEFFNQLTVKICRFGWILNLQDHVEVRPLCPTTVFLGDWHEEGCDVKSRTPVENIILFTYSLYALFTRFSQILNGFCFINVENRSTLKMSPCSSDYDTNCETVGSAFYVTCPLDPFPLQHGHGTAWPPNSKLRVVTES